MSEVAAGRSRTRASKIEYPVSPADAGLARRRAVLEAAQARLSGPPADE